MILRCVVCPSFFICLAWNLWFQDILARLAEVLHRLENTGMWALALDEAGAQWRLEALKGPNKGWCLFVVPLATPIRRNRETLFGVQTEP